MRADKAGINRILSSLLLASILLLSSFFVAPTFAQYQVVKAKSSIMIRLSASTINLGEQITITAQIKPESSGGFVIFQWSSDGKMWNDIAKVQPSKGIVSNNWKPHSVGQFLVRAVWSGDDRYMESVSNVEKLTVLEQQKIAPTQKELKLTLGVSVLEIKAGESLLIQVKVDPAADILVILQYSLDELNWITIEKLSISPDGLGKASWVPSTSGNVFLRAYYPGDEKYTQSLSNTVKILVKEPEKAYPAPTPTPSPAWIKLSIDKTSYSIGDTALIKALVGPVVKDKQVILMITGPDGRTYINEKLLPTDRGVVELKFAISRGYPAGEWLVTGAYIDAQAKALFRVIEVKEVPLPVPKKEIQITIKILKESYKPGERLETAVIISGGTAGDTAVAKVYDSSNRVMATFSWNIEGEHDEKSTDWIVVQDALPGVWRIVVEYGNTVASDNFSVETPEHKDVEEVPLRLDKGKYKPEDTVCLKGSLPHLTPSSKLIVLVLDIDEDVYLERELKAGDDGTISFCFELAEDAKLGEWSIQMITGDSIEELKFEVVPSKGLKKIDTTKTQGKAVIKNLKKMTLISVKNTGLASIASLFIKVDQGSIPFVKSKNWERQKLSDNLVALKSSKALQAGEQMVVMLKWKDKPEFDRTEMQLIPIQAPTDISPIYGTAGINLFFIAEELIQPEADVTIEITESISVSDTESATPPVEITITETISVSDTESVASAVEIQITETISVSDNSDVS